MNTLQHNLISLLVNQKKYDAITEFCHCEYPDEKDVIVSEYCGADIRLFTGSDGSINILCPKEMSTIQESAVTQAIENGTIFDDAESVDNTAKYLELTSLPYNAIINSGKEIPKHMHVAIGGVIGNMNDEGRCEVDDASLRNGYQCMKDMMNADTSDEQSINKIVDNYLGNPDHMSLHKKLRYDIGDLHKEIESIQDIDPEDVITDEDCCESFDEYDMDEIETESYVYDEMFDESYDDYEYYDDEIFQEGKTPNYVRNLKHLDYDPKTGTILSNVPIPGGKPGEKVRVKMIIDDDESRRRGPCCTWDHDSNGNRIPGSEVLHIPRRILKAKGIEAMTVVGHELGHVNYIYYPNSNPKLREQAIEHIKQNEHKLPDKNTHERDPEEFGADTHQIVSKRELKSGGRKVGFSGVTKSTALRGIEKNLSRITDKRVKECKQRINQIRYMIKKMETSRGNTSSQQLQELDRKCDELTKTIKSMNDEIEYIENGISQVKGMMQNLHPEDDKNMIQDLRNLVSQQRARQFDLEDKRDELMEKLKAHYSNQNNVQPANSLIAEMNDNLKQTENLIEKIKYEVKMRTDFIRKYIKEYLTDIPENTDVYQEGLFHKKPKKLKPIPRDIVPYITVEMNAIRDSNDQAMLSGYTCSKLELVDFYLNVIDTNDERYIVPHTRQYLVQLQNDLNRLLTQILRIKPINKSDRVWQVNVNYPENWRG